MAATQYISVLMASKKLGMTEHAVMGLAEKHKLRVYRGSLGVQLKAEDFAILEKQYAPAQPVGVAAGQSGKLPVLPAGPGSGKMTAPVAGMSDRMAADGAKGDGGGAEETLETNDLLLVIAAGDNAPAEGEAAGSEEGGDDFFGAVMEDLQKAGEPQPPAQPVEADDAPKTSLHLSSVRAPETGEAGKPGSGKTPRPVSEGQATGSRKIPVAEGSRALPAEPVAEGALSVGRTRHLFLDDYVVESLEHVRREWHAADKHPGNPVLMPDARWERGGYSVLGGSVLHDAEDKQFKMWYHVNGRLGRGVGYACSPDGTTWTKPELDVVPYKDGRTNLVMVHPTATHYAELLGVARFPETPDRSYRAAFVSLDPDKNGPRGIRTASSADGTHWTIAENLALPDVTGTGHLTRDEVDSQFLLFARGGPAGARVIQRRESKDFENWSAPETVMAVDSDDPPGGDVYGLSVMNYGRFYVGLVQVFHGAPECLIDVQLAFSHDGRKWHRPCRKPFIALGGVGEWDRFNTSAACGRIIRVSKKELWFYYGGRTYRHPSYKGEDTGGAWGAVGLAKLRVDGFASLNSGFRGGVVLTKPVVLKYPNLCVNVAARFGEVRVEILDEAGRPIPGMQSKPFVGDRHDAVLEWPEGAGLEPVLRRPVRLRFTLKNAKLFSFWSAA
jgi:hypothetical protein